MNFKSKLFAIAIAVASLAMAPSLFNINAADAASHWCENQGKSNTWVAGCKDGWYDHDHCLSYNLGTSGYAHGYNTGWKKGHCR
jgi:hypothetical protein